MCEGTQERRHPRKQERARVRESKRERTRARAARESKREQKRAKEINKEREGGSTRGKDSFQEFTRENKLVSISINFLSWLFTCGGLLITGRWALMLKKRLRFADGMCQM